VALQKTLRHVGNLRLKFDKRSQLFIGVHNETLSIGPLSLIAVAAPEESRRSEEADRVSMALRRMMPRRPRPA
jgi:hypothetical protein